MLRDYFPFAPSPAAKLTADGIRAAFSGLQELIEDTLPASDEKSTALAFLRTASMWSVACVMAHHPDHDGEEIDEPTVLVTEDVEIGGVQ